MTRTTTAGTTGLFGIDIAGELAAAITSSGGVTAAVLIKRTSRLRATADATNGTRQTEQLVPCQAIREEGGEPGKRTASIAILGATALLDGARVAPEMGDAITMLGEQWEVVGAPVVDAATALYECPCARVGQGSR